MGRQIFNAETQRTQREAQRKPRTNSTAAAVVNPSPRCARNSRSFHPSDFRLSLLCSSLRLSLRSLRLCVESVFALLLPLSALAQQQQMPHAGYVYPAGGRQGTTFEITVGGQFLDGAKSASVSGAGVQATVVDHFKPLTPAQAAQLRDQAKELSEKPSPTAEDRQKIAEIRAKLLAFVRRPTTPAIAETVRVQIALAAAPPLGEREFGPATPNGLPNPVLFSIGQLPEVGRSPATGTGVLPGAQAGRGRGQVRLAPEPPMEIALSVLVNGQIMPGGVDRFRFQATKGQHIVVAAKARELLPYI